MSEPVEARDLTALFDDIVTSHDGVCMTCRRGWGEHQPDCSVALLSTALRADTARVPEGLEDALRDLVSLMPADRYGFLRQTTRDFIDTVLVSPAPDTAQAPEGEGIEQWRDRVVEAMPWYDDLNPDYTDLNAVLVALRDARGKAAR